MWTQTFHTIQSCAIIEYMATWLGNSFVKSSGELITAVDASVKVVLVIHTAAWWGGCKPFKDRLKLLYDSWNSSEKVFEVVMVSGDRDEGGFKSTVGSYPWLSIPYSELSTRIAEIEANIPCTGYPTPGFVNAKTGAVLNADAYSDNWSESLLSKYLK